MNTSGLNLFIVDDDSKLVNDLQNFLYRKFGTYLHISTFSSAESVLRKVDTDTSIVILDYNLGGKNGNDVLKSIKEINPKTEVILLSSNEEVGVAIESFRKGATDYLIKGDKSWNRLIPHVYRIIAAPIRKLGKEFGLTKFMIIFLVTFILVGIVSFTILKILPD